MSHLDQRTYFHSGCVVWEVGSTEKEAAIREIVSRSQVFNSIQGLDLQDFADRVIARERIQSTGFGHGVAVAHGRSPLVEESLICLGVSREGIEYHAMDGEPVHLLFIVANHPDQQMDYLKVLSTLVGLVRNEIFRQELLDCLCERDVEEKLCSEFTARLQRA